MLHHVLNMLYFGLLFIQVLNTLGGTLARAQDKYGSQCKISEVRSASASMHKVDCSYLGLTSVPSCNHLPVECSSVIELNLEYNQIRDVTPGRLGEYTNLKQLDLSGNPVNILKNQSFQGLSNLLGLSLREIQTDVGCLHIENGTFSPLKSIKFLDLRFSPLNVRSLHSIFCHLCKNIEELVLKGINCEHNLISFNRRLTECLGKLNLKKLILDIDWIGPLTSAAVLNLRRLEFISARKNSIVLNGRSLYLFAAAHRLTYLDASCQYNNGCDDDFPWESFLPGVPKSFDVQAFSNKSVKPLNQNTTSLYFLPKLHTLKLSHYSLYVTFPSFCWANSHLVNLDISFSQRVKMVGVVDCLAYLRYLNLRHITSLACDMECFHGMPSLEVLMLGSTVTELFSRSSNASNIFEENKNLKFLDLSDLGLTNLPQKLLFHQNKLESLILSHNKFTNMRNLQVNFTSLQNLDLSSNSMFDIPVSIIKQMEEGIYKTGDKKRLNMVNNPFICVCSSIQQLQKVSNSKVNISEAQQNGRLTCVLMDKRIVSFPKAREILKKECHRLDKVSIVFFAFIYPVTLFILFACSCGYRYKWRIQYAWYKTVKLVKIQEEELQNDKLIFDAFVAHSQQDEEFVRLQLLRKLEHDKQPYSCCVHYRNFLPGEFISDNIVSAIMLSKKTILVVTKQFVRSGWCDFESRAAQCHHLGKTRGGIIAIVFPGGYEAAKRKPGLCAILDYVTFLPWPENEEEQNVFWLKLRMALGKPIVPVGGNKHVKGI